MDEQTKNLRVREYRVRRALQRQRLVLSRSRRRDRRAADFGTYVIANSSGRVVAGEVGDKGLSIAEVEEWVNTQRVTPVRMRPNELQPIVDHHDRIINVLGQMIDERIGPGWSEVADCRSDLLARYGGIRAWREEQDADHLEIIAAQAELIEDQVFLVSVLFAEGCIDDPAP